MIKIIVADDHPLVREGLKKILQQEKDFQVCGEAGNSEELISLLHNLQADVVILDINMPGRSGLDVIKQLKALQKIRILVISMYPEERFALRALRNGADGYISKTSPPGEMINVIRRIAAGRKYIPESILDEFILPSGDDNLAPHQRLSSRELEVLIKIGEGKKIREIAEELHLAVSTVNTYRQRILEKLHLNSTQEIIRYALNNKLVE